MRFRYVVILMLLAVTATVMAANAPLFADGPVVHTANVAAGEDLTALQQQTMQGIMMVIGRLGTQPALITAGARFVYYLRNGVVAQFDGQTALRPTRQLELFGELPLKPADTAPIAVRLNFGLEVVKRSAAAAMIVSGGDLLIATCDSFFAIDASTMKLKSTTNISLPGHDDMQFRLQDLMTAPGLRVAAHVAFITQAGTQLTMVSLNDGKVLNHSTLPKAMTPIAPATVMALFQGEMIGVGRGGGRGRIRRVLPGGPVEEPKNITLIGTIHHVELEGGFWAFDNRNGEKYVLTGDKLKELIATPNIEGARLRVTGFINNNPGIAMYGNGSFAVTSFQVMPVAN